MKQKNGFLCMLMIMGIFAVSCSSVKVRSYDYTNIKKQGVLQTPVVTDLNVVSEKKPFEKTYNHQSVATARENAMFDFTKTYNCDLIVQPQFSIDATTKVLFSADKYEDVKITLTGFPATYKNIRKFEPKDTLSFQLYKVTGFERDVPIESINEKKSKLGKYLGLGALVLVLIQVLGNVL